MNSVANPFMEDNVNIEDMLYVRENGHGTLTVSVPPEQVREVQEAIAIIVMSEGAVRGKSRGAIKALIEKAQVILDERDDIWQFLKPQLEMFAKK